VGGDCNQRPAVVRGVHVGDDVSCPVDSRIAAEIAELRGHPLRAALFEEGRSGDAAELQVLIVDPLFLARKPLQAVAHVGRRSQLGDGLSRSCAAVLREDRFGRCGQMPV
jgi:hypothetical protein